MSRRGGFPRGAGGAPNMNNLMKQAQKMQQEMLMAQEELAETEYEASAGGGMVSAVVTGGNVVKSLTINPDVVDPEDVEMLEDMVVAAVNEALRNAADASEQRMGALTGGMNIPGLM